jgi:hypothetical protein
VALVHRSPLLAGASAMAFYGCPDDCCPIELVTAIDHEISIGSAPTGPTVADPVHWRAPAQWLDPSFWGDEEQSQSAPQQFEPLPGHSSSGCATSPRTSQRPGHWYRGHRAPKGLLAKSIFLARRALWEAQRTGRRVKRNALAKSPRPRGRFHGTLALTSGHTRAMTGGK